MKDKSHNFSSFEKWPNGSGSGRNTWPDNYCSEGQEKPKRPTGRP